MKTILELSRAAWQKLCEERPRKYNPRRDVHYHLAHEAFEFGFLAAQAPEVKPEELSDGCWYWICVSGQRPQADCFQGATGFTYLECGINSEMRFFGPLILPEVR